MKNSNHETLRNRDRESVWHPYTRYSSMQSAAFPIIERGEGVYLFDTEGNRYLDGISSWWCCNLGHSHPALIAAMQRQAETLQHSILGNLSHPAAITLAEKLVSLFPTKDRRVHFASDGASAVEAALKIAVQYWYNIDQPQKTRFVSLANDYHGDTLGAVSVGFMESFHTQFASIVVPSFQAESPCCKACVYGKTPKTCLLECFSSMETIVKEHANELAAVIVEPLCQGASGMRIYTPKYLTALGALCKKHNVLLIVDEIAMGFGRTGKMFAFEHAGIDLDIVCVGKGLAGGYLPISAAIVKEEIFTTFTDQPEDHTFYHGHTFAGNPIAAAVASEVLTIYEQENIVENADRLGTVLQREMQAFEDLPVVANVRCLGMVGAVELKEGVTAEGKTYPEVVKQAMFERGVLIRPLGNVVYLMLPLVTPQELLCETVRELYEVVKGISI